MAIFVFFARKYHFQKSYNFRFQICADFDPVKAVVNARVCSDNLQDVSQAFPHIFEQKKNLVQKFLRSQKINFRDFYYYFSLFSKVALKKSKSIDINMRPLLCIGARTF